MRVFVYVVCVYVCVFARVCVLYEKLWATTERSDARTLKSGPDDLAGVGSEKPNQKKKKTHGNE